MMRLVAALAFAAALVATVGCTDEPAAEFGTGTERVFMRTCTEGDGGLSEELCRCTFERISETMTFEEYAEFDRQVRADPDALPDRILAIAAACAARIVAGAVG